MVRIQAASGERDERQSTTSWALKTARTPRVVFPPVLQADRRIIADLRGIRIAESGIQGRGDPRWTSDRMLLLAMAEETNETDLLRLRPQEVVV